jgi:hypothetical protein
MSEQRINTVLTEEETIKALKNQLNESEYKLLEKLSKIMRTVMTQKIRLKFRLITAVLKKDSILIMMLWLTDMLS